MNIDFLKNIKLRYKILIFPSLFAIIFVTNFLFFNHANNTNSKLLHDTENIYLPSIEASIEAGNLLVGVQRSLQDAVASADEAKLEATDTIAKRLTDICTNLSASTGGNIAADTIASKFLDYYGMAKEISAAMIAGDITKELSTSIPVMVKRFNDVSALVVQFEKDSKINAAAHFRDIQSNNVQTAVISASVALIGVIIMLIASYFISNAIVLPLRDLVVYMKRISQKRINFQVDESRRDEIGDLLHSVNEINKNFKEIIVNINETASNVLNAGSQLSAVSQQIAQSTNEQAATTEQISSSVEEMTANINQNSENTQETLQISALVTTDMHNVKTSFDDTLKAMKEIAVKINVVNEIADKTGMLAINASIEAAKAGEYGKGFAVVASEIRNLSEQSLKAAVSIESLSNDSVIIAQKTWDTLDKAIPRIQKTIQLINEIASASLEQNEGANLINQSVQQLVSVTNQNSATAEEMSAGAEQMTVQAETLKDIISQFNLNEEAQSRTMQELLKQTDLFKDIIQKLQEAQNLSPAERSVANQIIEMQTSSASKTPARKTEKSVGKSSGAGATIKLDDSNADKEFEAFN